jgi:hypothetical protein
MTLPAGSKKTQLKTTWRACVLDRLRSPPAMMAHADRTEHATLAYGITPLVCLSSLISGETYQDSTYNDSLAS